MWKTGAFPGSPSTAVSVSVPGPRGSSSRPFRRSRRSSRAGEEQLTALGVREDIAGKIAATGALDEAKKELEKLEKKAYTLMTFEDGDYPVLLREIFDPPLVLYVAGRTEALKGPAVSIVGARKPTPYGRAVAGKLAGDLASRGVVIVSGLARGIDACAHWGAVKEGRTVAVMGSGTGRRLPGRRTGNWRPRSGSGARSSPSIRLTRRRSASTSRSETASSAGWAWGWWSSRRPGTAGRSSRPGWPSRRTGRSWPSRGTSPRTSAWGRTG